MSSYRRDPRSHFLVLTMAGTHRKYAQKVPTPHKLKLCSNSHRIKIEKLVLYMYNNLIFRINLMTGSINNPPTNNPPTLESRDVLSRCLEFEKKFNNI